MNIPQELRYTQEHEWLGVQDGKARIGISDFAQDQLGDIVFVELPEVGRELKLHEAFGVVESVKSVSDLYAPVSGRVVAVNEQLVDSPETLNQDPYENGWIIEIEVADQSEIGQLLDAAAYTKHTEGEH